MTPRIEPPTGSLAHVLVVPMLVVFLVAAACSSAPNPLATDATTPSTTTPTTQPPTPDETVAPEPDTSAQPDSEPALVDLPASLEIADDGWFPWVFPTPSTSWYEGGCPSPDDVARNFMSNFFDEPDPMLTSLSASLHPDHRRIFVHTRGEGGIPTDRGTVLELVRVDLDIVDCEAWVIVSAASEFVKIDSVGFTNDGERTVATVSGEGMGFEALINLQVHDESFRIVAQGFAMGGAYDVQPFTGSAGFVDAPIDPNLIVIASSSNPADGATPQFGVVKARCCGSEDVVAPPASPDGPAVAVIGVRADDTLNVRSGPGVDNEVVGELSPFHVGAIVRPEEPVVVGDDTWIAVTSDGLDGWVNERFVTSVEADEPLDPALLRAAQEVRTALSSNSAVERMADLSADRFGPEVVISTDAFIAPDDQRLTADDFLSAGSADDTIRQWGFTDGEGTPIEGTIAEYLAGVADSPALTETDRVAVDRRIRSSNTIDNLSQAFPSATVVEFHHDGGTGEAADFAWGTLRLAYEPSASGPRLVAIVTDNWTI